MHSFYDFNYVRKLPLKNVTRLIIKAQEKETDKLLMIRWMIHYQNKMSFSEFKEQISPQISTRPTNEILAEVAEIRKALKEGE